MAHAALPWIGCARAGQMLEGISIIGSREGEGRNGSDRPTRTTTHVSQLFGWIVNREVATARLGRSTAWATMRTLDSPGGLRLASPQRNTGAVAMVGMLQILTYMFAFYMVLKGLEFVHRAMASTLPKKQPLFVFAGLTLAACAVAAFGFVKMQEAQALDVSTPSLNQLY